MYYVTDGLYCLSNQVIWQDSPFISEMQAPALDSDDFVALSTCTSSVVFAPSGTERQRASFIIFMALLGADAGVLSVLFCSAALIGNRNSVLLQNH